MAETTIHQQLKALYSEDEAGQEVQVDGFRIDAVVGDCLIEIQCAGLSAIRSKIKKLVQTRDVLVVKPLCEKKMLLKRKRKGGKVVSKRKSPLHENYYDIFDELVHFTSVFPHPRLTLEILLTEQEETRLPPLRKSWRQRPRVEDRRLVSVTGRMKLRDNCDLLKMLPNELPKTFNTSDLAECADIPRWLAQKMAYCLRHSGAIKQVGKNRNTVLYERTKLRRRRKTKSRAA
jgi:hypothetical protein